MTRTDLLPCGCPIIWSLFDSARGRVLITLKPIRDEVRVTVPGSVWCAQGHGWQTPSHEEFERLAAVTQ